LNGYCATMDVELNEATMSNEANLCEVDNAVDESRWKPEVDVMYDVDESPPISLCLLLGFQVIAKTELPPTITLYQLIRI